MTTATAIGRRRVVLRHPSLYAGLIADTAPRVAVEHARLDCKILETVLGLAIADVAAGGTVAVFAPEPARAKWVAQRLVDRIMPDAKRFAATSGGVSVWCWEPGSGGQLWLVGGRAVSMDALPFTSPERCFVVAAHEIATDLPALFAGARVLATGELADSGHWFHAYARSDGVSVHRFDAHTIAAAMPDIVNGSMPKSDPAYERAMLLRDVEVVGGHRALRVFARERLRIRTIKDRDVLSPRQRAALEGQYGSAPIVPFELNHLQKTYLARKRLAVRQGRKPWFLLLKYRRGGFTTFEQGGSYHTAVTQPRSYVMTLAHKLKSTQRIFRMIELFYRLDPQRPKRVGVSKSTFEFVNGSLMFIGTAGAAAESRGDTLQKAHGSEVAFWNPGPNQIESTEEQIAGILGAASHGEVTLETTPNGSEWFKREYERAKTGESEFTPIFFRWFDDPTNRLARSSFNAEEIADTITEREKMLMVAHSLDFEQIAFRRQQQKTYGRLFPQEMPEDDVTCFLVSGTCYFSVPTLTELLDELAPVPTAQELPGTLTEINGAMWRAWPGGYEVRWEPPKPGRIYVAGADTSEGLPGCDRNGIGIVDFESGAQVASVHGLFAPDVLASHGARIGTDYNRALLGVERENHGHAVLQALRGLGYDHPHFRGGPLFYWQQNKEDVRKSRAGWTTNGETRPVMLAELAKAIEPVDGVAAMKVRDRDFVSEALNFKLQDNGKWSADPGEHDDTVMKWAIAWQMRKHYRPVSEIHWD